MFTQLLPFKCCYAVGKIISLTPSELLHAVIEAGQMEETSVDCDLALVVHCASLVTRSEYVLLVLHSQAFHRSLGMRLHYIMKPQEKQFFFFLLCITYFHFQGNGDSFKSQSVYKGILSARCDVFTCMMIMLLSISSVCSVSYWRICNNSSEGTSEHRCKGLSPKTPLPQSPLTLTLHLLSLFFPPPLLSCVTSRKLFSLVSSAYWSSAQTMTLHLWRLHWT